MTSSCSGFVAEALERARAPARSSARARGPSGSLRSPLDLPHLRLAERREAEHERDLRVVVGRERELRLEVLGELGPHLLASEERVERGERAWLDGIELEHLAVRGDRVVGPTELLLVDLAPSDA